MLSCLLLLTELLHHREILETRCLGKLARAQLLTAYRSLLRSYSCLLACQSTVKLGYATIKLGLSLLP